MKNGLQVTIANVAEKLGAAFPSVAFAGLVWGQLDMTGMAVFLIAGALSSLVGTWLKAEK